MHKTKAVAIALTAAILLGAPMAKAESVWDSLTYGVDFTLVSDYVFRGVNFSDYVGEGAERPNYQLNVYGAMDTEIGTFGATIWFEWYSGQHQLTPDSDGLLQEVDYVLYYGNSIGPVDAEIGWIAYQFPQASGDAYATYEVYVSLGMDDSIIWGTEEPILNPSLAWYMDFDDYDLGQWFEFSISHDFAMGELVEMLKDFTVTPSFLVGVDHRYLDEGTNTQMGTLVYGLDVAYDLSSALKMPEEYGSLGITGFLAFSQGVASNLDDIFYGGVTLSYAK